MDKYEIKEKLGQGSFGAVYRGVNKASKGEVGGGRMTIIIHPLSASWKMMEQT